jgi:pseudoazurin
MRKALLLGAVISMAIAGTASAAEVEVKMLNRGAEGAMVFEPALVKIEPGDTVKFVPTDKGHNAETIDGMVPEAAMAFAGKMNKEVSVTFDKDGVYGIRCKPHYAMGMVGLVVVGKPGNEDQAKGVKQPGKAKQIFSALFDKLARTQTAQK